jgi:hypothetical protein
MPPSQHRRQRAPEHQSPLPSTATTPRKPIGRPQGAPSTILNLRLPLDLLAQLDRYLDSLELHTGLKANRGMIVRRALALFLETHPLGDTTPRTSGGER